LFDESDGDDDVNDDSDADADVRASGDDAPPDARSRDWSR
jgi:hypothetical protein